MSAAESACNAAIQHPSGDQRMCQKPLDPSNSVRDETSRSNTSILLGCEKRTKANRWPSGDHAGSAFATLSSVNLPRFSASLLTVHTFHGSPGIPPEKAIRFESRDHRG